MILSTKEILNGTGRVLLNATKREIAAKEVLHAWAAWWDGPGRRNYHGSLLPPLTKTAEVLSCQICAGIEEPGEKCAACGRKL